MNDELCVRIIERAEEAGIRIDMAGASDLLQEYMVLTDNYNPEFDFDSELYAMVVVMYQNHPQTMEEYSQLIAEV